MANDTGAKREMRPWTVMVYMAAGDNAEMDDYAVRDLREMQRGANEHVHVAVQVKRHWPEIPQLYVITGSGPESVAQLRPAKHPEDTDMGEQNTLTHFLEWAVEECPAHRYMLVLWGHSYGLGFGRDHGDPLRLSELVKALKAFRDKRIELGYENPNGCEEGEDPKRKGILDILGANACAMSYTEAAYELRNSANYLLASQIYVPFAGWPYDAVLETITKKTEHIKETTPEQLGFNVIDSYVTGLNNPLTGERVQMSLLNLSYAEDLMAALQGLASAVRGAFKSDGQFDSSRRAAIRDAFIAAAAGDVRPLVDLKDLSCALKRDLCDPLSRALVSSNPKISYDKRKWLENSAQFLEKQLNHVEDLLRPQMEGGSGLLVVKTDAHPSLADLGGVGVYVPFVTDEKDLKRLGLEDDPFRSGPPPPQDRSSETSRTTYERLAIFSQDATAKLKEWPALVYDDLNEPLPSELVDLIAGIGVTSSSDRSEIAQIVLSIESTFNKLDRVLDMAETVVMRVLRQARSDAHTSDSNNVKHPPLRLMTLAAPATEKGKAAQPLQVTEPILLEWFRKLEAALEEVERTTKKGLTQARFGLGPVASPRGFAGEPPKYGEGAPPRDDRRGFSGEPPKYGEGPPTESTIFGNAHVVNGDPEVGPAFQLFRRAADALRRLEQAAFELERQAGGSLGREVFERRALGLRQAFGILCETATSARRTIRSVIANPLYGLGPGAAAFDRDDREELANAAGMGANNLLLLSVTPLTPEPDKRDLAIYYAALNSALDSGIVVDAPVPGRT